MASDKLRDGRAINFPSIPWHRNNGYCPVLHEPCACSPGGLARDFCRMLLENEAKDGK